MDDSDERPWWLSRDGDAGGPGETGDAADHESNAQDRSAGSTQGCPCSECSARLPGSGGNHPEPAHTRVMMILQTIPTA